MNQITKICIDGRRTDQGGIGRLTEEAIRTIAEIPNVNLFVLTNETNKTQSDIQYVHCTYKPLTLDEYLYLPELLNSVSIQLFISMQFYSPHSIKIPTISWVHDAWPLEHPEWLPLLTALPSKYGADSFAAGEKVFKEFLRLRKDGLLFPENKFLQNALNETSTNLYRFIVASYSLNLYRSECIITCSEYSKNAICSFFPEVNEKVVVIYNPIPAFIRESFNTNPCSTGDILHVSKWEPRKNIINLIHAFSKLVKMKDDVRLHLVGNPVSAEYAREVHNVIANSGVESKIIIHRGISDKELSYLYCKTSVFIMPSFCEGFSFPSIEALFSGIPIAASHGSALSEVLGAAAVYFDPANIECITNVLFNLLTDTSICERLKENASIQKKFLRSHNFRNSIVNIIEQF